MADNKNKLNHDVAVAALNSIRTEASLNANSGDLRVAGNARRDYLFADILLVALDAIGAENFDNANYPDLPTPESLDAAQVDPSNPVTSLVPNAGTNPTVPAPDTGQPQNADELASSQGTPPATPETPSTPAPASDTAPSTPAPASDTAPANTGTDTAPDTGTDIIPE